MDFKKDILLIDIEATGTDINKHEIIQLAAVLLDGKTLKEKQAFTTYIKPQKWQSRDPEAMAVNKINYFQVKNAPSLVAAIKKFNGAFPKNVIYSRYGGIMDIIFVQKAYAKAKIKWPFDYHYFDLWSVFFPYMAKKKLLTNKHKYNGFTLENCLRHFKIKVPSSRHDALTDCRVEAEVLRNIIKKLK